MLKELNLTEFENCLRGIVSHLFNDEAFSKEEQTMLGYMLESGTHGSLQHKVENELQKAGDSRIMYWVHRAFPGRNWFAIRHPFIAKYPIFIPFSGFIASIWLCFQGDGS